MYNSSAKTDDFPIQTCCRKKVAFNLYHAFLLFQANFPSIQTSFVNISLKKSLIIRIKKEYLLSRRLNAGILMQVICRKFIYSQCISVIWEIFLVQLCIILLYFEAIRSGREATLLFVIFKVRGMIIVRHRASFSAASAASPPSSSAAASSLSSSLSRLHWRRWWGWGSPHLLELQVLSQKFHLQFLHDFVLDSLHECLMLFTGSGSLSFSFFLYYQCPFSLLLLSAVLFMLRHLQSRKYFVSCHVHGLFFALFPYLHNVKQ